MTSQRTEFFSSAWHQRLLNWHLSTQHHLDKERSTPYTSRWYNHISPFDSRFWTVPMWDRSHSLVHEQPLKWGWMVRTMQAGSEFSDMGQDSFETHSCQHWEPHWSAVMRLCWKRPEKSIDSNECSLGFPRSVWNERRDFNFGWIIKSLLTYFALQMS